MSTTSETLTAGEATRNLERDPTAQAFVDFVEARCPPESTVSLSVHPKASARALVPVNVVRLDRGSYTIPTGPDDETPLGDESYWHLELLRLRTLTDLHGTEYTSHEIVAGVMYYETRLPTGTAPVLAVHSGYSYREEPYADEDALGLMAKIELLEQQGLVTKSGAS